MDEAIATVHAALDGGVVRFIDTALAYSRSEHDSFAESVVAEALRQRMVREDVLIATKGGHRRVGEEFPVDASPAALRADCDRSLRALGVEVIDLYQLHHVDPEVPLIESVGALRALQLDGKVRLIGLSNVDIDQIEEALTVAPIASVQNRLSLRHRGDLPTTKYCTERSIAYLAYMPLGGGGGRTRPDEAVNAVATRHGVSAARVQLAWLQAQPSDTLPLVGASRAQTILDSMAATDVHLSEEDLRTLG
jgi:pyridoxine 4-dehydrogenase